MSEEDLLAFPISPMLFFIPASVCDFQFSGLQSLVNRPVQSALFNSCPSTTTYSCGPYSPTILTLAFWAIHFSAFISLHFSTYAAIYTHIRPFIFTYSRYFLSIHTTSFLSYCTKLRKLHTYPHSLSSHSRTPRSGDQASSTRRSINLFIIGAPRG